jgi:glycosyltransferase involved in cell wall biosynthesis
MALSRLQDIVDQYNKAPFISVIVLCRNEQDHIRICLDSIITNSYPKDRYEILVVDGMSSDGTRDIVAEYMGSLPVVRLLDNTKKSTPCAHNIGISNSAGDIVLITSAHASYLTNFIETCVDALFEYEADCVGGVIDVQMRSHTFFSSAIQLTLTHMLGVGGSKFRTGVQTPQWVDAIPYGCFRKSLLDRVGPYNEALERSQDMDFWSRVRQAGGKILLHPQIRSTYLARSKLFETLMYNFSNGFWITWPMRLVGTRFAVRHFIPLVFVVSFVGLIIAGLFWAPLWWLLGLQIFIYTMALLWVSTSAAVRKKEPLLVLTGPIAFSVLHIGYGFGSLWGLLKPMRQRT